MNISIISYSFRGLQVAGKIGLFGYLETVRYRYGLRAADLWSGTLLSLEAGCVSTVRAALEERELTLACLAVDGAHLWEPDQEARTEESPSAGFLRPLARLVLGRGEERGLAG